MEQREGWLGYVAVGLGALALLIALIGSTGAPANVQITLPEAGMNQRFDVVPPAAAPAPADVLPDLPPLEGFPEADRQKMRALQEQMRSWREQQRSWMEQQSAAPFQFEKHELWMNEARGWNRDGGPPPFVPNVFKLIIATLAIGFGLKLVRGRKDGAGPTTAPPSPPSVA